MHDVMRKIAELSIRGDTSRIRANSRNVRMNGWIDEWKDGCMDVWTDGWL